MVRFQNETDLSQALEEIKLSLILIKLLSLGVTVSWIIKLTAESIH